VINVLLNLSIKRRVYVLILVIFLGTGWAFALSAHYVTTSLYEARYEQTRRLIETAHSLIKAIEKESKDNGLTEEEAKKQALAYIRRLRYDNKEYFWIQDTSGFLLFHPDPQLSGKAGDAITDKEGRRIILDMAEIAKKKGEGRYSYYWPPTPPSKLKVSYIKRIEPWDWVVGSGVFVEDIGLVVKTALFKLALAIGVTALIAFAVAFFVGRSISRPIQMLNKAMQKLAGGDLSAKLPEGNGPQEILSMTQTVRVFLENAQRISLLESEQRESEGMKTEFVSVVSHELRTPLTSIRGSLGLVATGKAGELPEKAKKLISIAYSNCERLILLINDILDIDKIAAGNMHFDQKAESINGMVATAVDANRSYAEKYFVHFEYTPLPEDASILVDANRFQQVITNFLSNAAKFSPAGAKIDIIASIENCCVRVSVKDYGLGIPDEFRSRIFKKFSQADSSTTRRKGGTGLGLYISKQIIEQMGGRIGYNTRVGLGSSFWVEFPLSEGTCEYVPTPPSKENHFLFSSNAYEDDSEEASLPLILHIETNNDFSQYLSVLLHDQAELLRTSSITSAMEALRTEPKPISAVVIDLNIEDISLLRDLSNQVKERGLPLMVLSARDPTNEQREMLPLVMIKSRTTEDLIVQTVIRAIRAKPINSQEVT